MSWTGLVALLLSPFGGFSVCIAAITAAICMGDEVDPDPTRCWMAAALAGVFYLLAGLSGALIAALFVALPSPLIATLAGLALLSTFSGSLTRALAEGATITDEAAAHFLSQRAKNALNHRFFRRLICRCSA